MGTVLDDRQTGVLEPASSAPVDSLDFAEALRERRHAARGVVTGIGLGAALWAAILALAGVIKL